MTSFRKKKKQYKKDYFIGEDSFGNTLYALDEVEIFIPTERTKPFLSRIYWTRMDGAMIQMTAPTIHNEKGYTHRPLRYFLEQSPIKFVDEDDKPVILQGYVKKVRHFYQWDNQ